MNYCFIITGYNCQDYVAPCIDSVITQLVPEGCSMRILVMDDDSEDATYNVASASAKSPTPYTIFTHSHQTGAARSRYDLMGMSPRPDVFILLDLDDYLPHSGVLLRIHREYRKGAQATFGNWRFHENEKVWDWKPLTPPEIATGAFRQMPFACPPLRTFRADIALQVTPAELQDDDGQWLRCCTDVALSWAVLDRVDPERVAYIDEVLYVYRGHHPNVTRKRYGSEKKRVMQMLRKRTGVAV